MPSLALGFFNCQQFHIPSKQPTEGILSPMESYECITELLDGNLVCFPVDSLFLSSALPKQKCTHRTGAEGTQCTAELGERRAPSPKPAHCCSPSLWRSLVLSHTLCRAGGADPTTLGVIHSSKLFFSPLFMFFNQSFSFSSSSPVSMAKPFCPL